MMQRLVALGFALVLAFSSQSARAAVDVERVVSRAASRPGWSRTTPIPFSP
jgi:hypothetical protein